MPWICFAMPVQPLGRQLDDGHRLRHFSQRPITRIINILSEWPQTPTRTCSAAFLIT